MSAEKTNSLEDFSFDLDSIFGEFTPSNEPNPTEPDKSKPTNVNKTSNDGDEDEIERDEDGIPINVLKAIGEVEEDEGEDDIDDKDIPPKDPLEEEEEGDESEDKEDGDSDIEVEYSYKGIASHLAEQGIIDFEDAEDLEDSPELLEKAIEDTVYSLIDEYKNSIPEIGKQFLDYIEKGGDPESFLNVLEKPFDLNNLDLENTENQKRVIRELLKEQNYSNEEIEEAIQDYEDGLILDKRAKTAANRLKTIYDKKAEALVKEQEEIEKAQRKQVEEYVGNIKSYISTAENIAGLQVNKKDKQLFEKYLLERDKDGKTQYQRDVEEDPTKTQLELAYLKFKKYDFSTAKRQGRSEESKRINRMIKTTDRVRATREQKTNSSGKRSLDLSEFRSFL